MAASERANPNERDSASTGTSDTAGGSKPKRWYERTSVTLCVATALALVGLGFVHIILGVTSPYGLPFDIVRRDSFGCREAIVNTAKIGSLPFPVARFKYPLSVAALQRRGYINGGPAFEARLAAWQRERVSLWQRQFESALGRTATCWTHGLLGQEQTPPADPESVQACNQRGIAFAQNGEHQAALAEFTRAIRRDPTYTAAFCNRALISIEIGNLGQAASDLGAVIEIKPELIEARIRRGRLYLAMNEHDKAIAEFTKAIEIEAKCAEAFFHRSLVYFVRGDYDRALADVRTVQSLGLPVPAELSGVLQGTTERDTIEASATPDH